MTPISTIIRKSNAMYGNIILVWILCLIHFNPKLFSVLPNNAYITTKVTYCIFILFLNLFWLYGIYHCFFLLYKILPKKYRAPEGLKDFPRVAILYTTRNDFTERAALSCVRQQYPNFHVYLLDDSTDAFWKATVDQFHQAHPQHTTVIRRSDRQGFKAGNLNNALRHHARQYPYFAVIDADEVIPADFLVKLLPYFRRHENIAFVQAHHEQNPRQPSCFAQDLAPGITFYWDVYQPPRNEHGFVTFYGHGAIIRHDVWAKVGGFPEIVSEDLAFSTRIRQFGYHGYFVRDVTCYEDFPETYLQFRRRYEKWVKGACEYVHREFLPFLLSRHVTVPEKLDVLFSCMSLFLPSGFLVYIFIANALLPVLLAEKYTMTLTIFGYRFELLSVYFLEPNFKALWTPDFYVITIIGMFSSMFCYCVFLLAQPRKMVKLLLKSAVPYIALILVSACSIVAYVLTRKAVFLTTGDKTTQTLVGMQGGREGFIARLHANHPLVFHLEWIFGLTLTYFCFMTMNFALLTIASCLVLSPLIARYGWDNRTLSILASLPLFFVLMAFGSMGLGFIGIQGFSLHFLALHF
jgi:cellulose synthase/poly-beta-1,6-N-acetylglucosamine synthase-like glycosyltransferase